MKATQPSDNTKASWWARQSSVLKAMLIVGAVLAIGRLSAIFGLVQVTSTATTATASVPAPPADPSRISMEQYKLLSPGMSYRDAVNLLGAEGVELSSNDIAGIHTVMYQWKAGFMANMNATFQNGKLVSKAQAGLR